jgi:hypothetical protein
MGVYGYGSPAKYGSITGDKINPIIVKDRLLLKASDGKLLVERCLVVET